MRDRSILFFDIDGTLISDDGERYLPESAREALTKARAAGHLTFINTGRVYINVDDFLRALSFDGYVCGCGTEIRYRDEVLFHHTLSAELIRRTADLAYACGMFVLYEGADSNAYDSRLPLTGEPETLINYFRSMGREMLTDVHTDAFRFDKFTGWFDEKCDIERFRREIAPDFDYIDRGPYFCEIVPKGYSKATGIQFLLEYFNIPWENSYVFGDSTNDLSMLTFAKHSIVMGDSPDSLKEQAEFVTKGVRDDGIYYAMQHYQLL